LAESLVLSPTHFYFSSKEWKLGFNKIWWVKVDVAVGAFAFDFQVFEEMNTMGFAFTVRTLQGSVS
jgi:hypothetical protein